MTVLILKWCPVPSGTRSAIAFIDIEKLGDNDSEYYWKLCFWPRVEVSYESYMDTQFKQSKCLLSCSVKY